eukprot:6170-Heterococcus_DN1.PRE.2
MQHAYSTGAAVCIAMDATAANDMTSERHCTRINTQRCTQQCDDAPHAQLAVAQHLFTALTSVLAAHSQLLWTAHNKNTSVQALALSLLSALAFIECNGACLLLMLVRALTWKNVSSSSIVSGLTLDASSSTGIGRPWKLHMHGNNKHNTSLRQR